MFDANSPHALLKQCGSFREDMLRFFSHSLNKKFSEAKLVQDRINGLEELDQLQQQWQSAMQGSQANKELKHGKEKLATHTQHATSDKLRQKDKKKKVSNKQ